MRLIPDWRSAYKKFSVQALALIGALQGLPALVPGDLMSMHVSWWTGHTWADVLSYVTLALAILGIVLRLLQQEDGDGSGGK